MNKPKWISKLFLLIAWVTCDILLFRFSREGYAQYAGTLLGVPLVLSAAMLLTWHYSSAMALGSWEVFQFGLWSKLISFHWYVIPIVYNFQQREDWPLEIGHHALALLVQVSIVLSFLRLGRSLDWYRTEVGNSGANAMSTVQRS